MNRIKNFAVILVLGVLISSCGKQHNLTAELEGVGNDTILVQYAPVSQFYAIDEPFTDTIIAANGKFTYDLSVQEPIMAYIFPKKGEFKRMDGSPYLPLHKYLVLLIRPNDHIKVKGKLHDYYLEFTATGSEFGREHGQIRNQYMEEVSQTVKIELQLDSLRSTKGDKEQINKLLEKRKQISTKAYAAELEYAKNNWDKELSAFYLARQRVDTLGKYYENIDPKIRNGIFKNMLEIQYLKYQKHLRVKEAEANIAEGKIAPDFSLQSITGEEFTLGSITDKIIVLDFWGSWCGWCIKGFPKMKEYYNKYNGKMEIVGIACRDTESQWKEAVEKNELIWQHVINDKDIDKDVSVMYAVQGYPTKIILDKDKKILAKFVGESDDFYKKLDELFKK